MKRLELGGREVLLPARETGTAGLSVVFFACGDRAVYHDSSESIIGPVFEEEWVALDFAIALGRLDVDWTEKREILLEKNPDLKGKVGELEDEFENEGESCGFQNMGELVE